MGRPTKLTPERSKRIVDLIRAGNTRETAAGACGITATCLYSWLQRGRKELERLAQPRTKPRASETLFAEFAEAVEKADREAESWHVANIRRAASDHWQASAWWLERTRHQTWGRKDRHEHVGQGGGPVVFEVVIAADQDGEGEGP